MRLSWLLLTVVVCAACSASEEDRPAEFVPDASTTAPRKCDQVRKGEVVKGAVWYDGEPAACGANGMECPVYDLADFAAVCKIGTAYATCQNGKWVVWCDLDAGISDAAVGDAGSD